MEALKETYRKKIQRTDGIMTSRQSNFSQVFNRNAIGSTISEAKIIELNLFILRLFLQDGQIRHTLAKIQIFRFSDYLVKEENLKILKQLKRKASDATIHCALVSEYRSGMIHGIRSRPKQSNRFIHSLKYEYLSLEDRRQDVRYL